MQYFPGSIIEKSSLTGKQFLDGMFSGVSGLVMSQIREFTGLNTPAIQNWVNRGWVSRPKGKKYSEDQVARILIINMLRQTMQLESVAKLLFYVNGVAGDETDDIIYESELYGYVCDILFSDADDDTVDRYIDDIIRGFRERRPGDAKRLKTALKIIYLNCKASKYISRAEQMLTDLHVKMAEM